MKNTETKLKPTGSPFEGVVTLIGIDPGVHTGLAVVTEQRLVRVASPAPSILEAMDSVRALTLRDGPQNVLVIWEDARKIGGMHGMARGTAGDTARLRGVGSVHRDCAIWEEFLERHQLRHVAISPAAKGAKLSDGQFRQVSGWTLPTNQHSRDAAMMVWGKRGLTPKTPNTQKTAAVSA